MSTPPSPVAAAGSGRLARRAANVVESAEQLDPIAATIAGRLTALLPKGRVRDLLSGRPLGHPLHPAIMLVPAGSLLSSTVLDLTGAPPAAGARLVRVGLLAALPTAAAGWSDWLDTAGPERRVGLVHAASNIAGLTAYALSLPGRTGGSRTRSRAFSLLGAAALGLGGWLGGHLSYALGVGVDTTAFDVGPTEWTSVMSAAEVDSSLSQVSVDGTALLVTRLASGKVVALADRCTHRGGPLSEGERDGDCVVCPWHASSFSLADGSVTSGPAVYGQPVYEAREIGGRVEVRRQEDRTLRAESV